MRGQMSARFRRHSDDTDRCINKQTAPAIHLTCVCTYMRSKMASRFDPNFTDNVVNAMGPGTSPRFRQLMTGLIRHVHDFARENELTVDEWMAGVQLMNWAGQMSDSKRNEGQLVCDVVGLESYFFQQIHLYA